MTTHTNMKIGVTTANQRQYFVYPRDRGLPPKYPAFILHGAGALADAPSLNPTITSISRYGLHSVSGDWGGVYTWGNDAAMNALDDAYNWLQNQPGVKKGKVAIHGGSMGGLNSLVWAARNPTRVASVTADVPVLDLAGIWRDNIANFRPLIDSAYSGGYNEGLNSARDPLTMAANGHYAGMKILINYGDVDDICLPAKAQLFKSLVPTAEVYQVPGGHGPAQGNIDRSYQSKFIIANT